MSVASPIAPHVARRYVLPVLAILLAQICLYILMASRGFDFTDESYYLHNFRHWRDFTGTVTFFGAYLEWPFRALGSSIANIRIFSLLLILGSGAVLMHEILRFAFSNSIAETRPASTFQRFFWYLIAPMASSVPSFGGFTTLRIPSYNVLSLCTMAIMTACVLRFVDTLRSGRKSSAIPLAYGVLLGVCFLSKATTAVLVVSIHLIFFLALNREWNWKKLSWASLLICAGFLFNFLFLTISFPDWMASLREGINMMHIRDPRYGTGALVSGLRWELRVSVLTLGPWMLAGGLAMYFARKWLAASGTVVSLVAIGLTCLAPLVYANVFKGKLWLGMTFITAAGLWLLERLAMKTQAPYDGRREFALMALLFLLPIVFSFGTNNSVLAHSTLAAMFAFCAVYLRLYRLAHAGLLPGKFLATCLVVACLPVLLAQWRAWTDVRFTYRQPAPLQLQDTPIPLGSAGDVVRVDALTARSLHAVITATKAGGMAPGQDILDLAGDLPGVIYAVGGRPLGSPWMLGGYPGSEAGAARTIELVDTARVRQSWILTSTNNPRRIKGWADILAQEIGPSSHELIASFDFVNPHGARPDEPKVFNLQLWKPAGAPAAGVGAVAAIPH